MACKNLRTNVLVAIVAFFLHACVHTGFKSEILLGEADVGLAKAEKIVAVGNPPFATLSLENGIALYFVDVGDGHVGIVEHIPSKASSIVLPMLSKWTASPLEIYLAFKPTADEVPNALITDHKSRVTRSGNADVPPRQLQLQQRGTGGPEIICGDGHLDDPWSLNWNNAFEGVTEVVRTAREHHRSVFTIYPGYNVYKGTGTNRITYLGACNGWNSENIAMGFEVHRWSSVAQSWVLVPGTDLTLQIEEQHIFYSGHPTGRYRARVSAITEAVPHIGLGGAWTKSFPVGIEF